MLLSVTHMMKFVILRVFLANETNQENHSVGRETGTNCCVQAEESREAKAS
jgi:hypothetical protein